MVNCQIVHSSTQTIHKHIARCIISNIILLYLFLYLPFSNRVNRLKQPTGTFVEKICVVRSPLVNWRSQIITLNREPAPPLFLNFLSSGRPVNVLTEVEERDDVKIKPIKLELLEDDRLPQHCNAHVM